jgi:hypothetical protein
LGFVFVTPAHEGRLINDTFLELANIANRVRQMLCQCDTHLFFNLSEPLVDFWVLDGGNWRVEYNLEFK